MNVDLAFHFSNCYNHYQVTATMSQHLLAVYIPPYLTCHVHIPTEVFTANILYYAATTKMLLTVLHFVSELVLFKNQNPLISRISC